MKKNLLLYSLVVFALQLSNAQMNLLTESFETDGEGTRYTSNFFNTGGCDYFIRDNSTASCLTNNPTGTDGSFYWTGEDCDAASGGTGILTLNALPVTGFDLDMDVLIAVGRFNDGRFEAEDELLFQYNIDGDGWNTFGAFYGSFAGGPFSNDLFQDTDLDGTGNSTGIEITSNGFINVNMPIPATGNSLQIRVIMGQNQGTEEIMIDNIRINGTIALPIELTEFSVNSMEEDKVKINWQTASEVNNEYFSILRSKDGFSWEEIKKVNGAGSSTRTIDYSTIDEKPFSGVSYYRLKQVDFNGGFEFSNTKSVHLEILNSKYSIYPNPVHSGQFNVEVPNDGTEIYILDASGKLIYQATIDKGINEISLDEFYSGIHFVKFIHSEKWEVQKLILEPK